MTDLKAPWEFRRAHVMDRDGEPLARVIYRGIDDREIRAIGRLMAAAPTVAARCERLEGALTQVNACLLAADESHDINDALDIIQAAFAEAGEDKT